LCCFGYNLYILTENELKYFHLCIPLLTIFPLNSEQEEILLLAQCNTKILTIGHQLIALIYFIVFPIVGFVLYNDYILLIAGILFVIVILLAHKKVACTSLFEAITTTFVALHFHKYY
jgi:hypothetical protein